MWASEKGEKKPEWAVHYREEAFYWWPLTPFCVLLLMYIALHSSFIKWLLIWSDLTILSHNQTILNQGERATYSLNV